MMIELNNICDIYKETKTGKKLIKKDALYKQIIETNEILTINQIINDKGHIEKNLCQIFVKDIGSLTVNHSYESMKNLIIKEDNNIGFQIKNKTK